MPSLAVPPDYESTPQMRAWLHTHGYLRNSPDLGELMTTEALALISNVAPSEITIEQFENNSFPDALVKKMRRGTKELSAKYGTANLTHILYMEARSHE